MSEPTSKMCGKCGTEKPAGDFYRAAKAKDGLQHQCKQCANEYGRAYYQQNRQKVKERSAAWYAENRDARRESQIAWYQANKDSQAEYQRRRNAEMPGERARLVAAWRARNPERATELSRRRRAQERETRIGPIDLDALWTGSCGICGEPLDRSLRHPDPLSKSVDHIVPLAVGGTHEQSNLQWAHLRCNVIKGARPPASIEGEVRKHGSAA